ncbi:MAG: c-type cytochrome [Planctomycetaceae bacterium]
MRVQALSALDSQASELLNPLIQRSLKSETTRPCEFALELLAKHDPRRAVIQIAATLKTSYVTAERQRAAALCAELDVPGADRLLYTLIQDLTAAESADIRLEVIEAAEIRSRDNSQLAASLAEFRTAREQSAGDDPAAAFDECLVGGDPQRGRQLFLNHISAQCVRCHRVGRQGSNIGPRLDDVALRRDAKYLLRSIVAPSADIDDKYRSQVVVMNSGKVVQGLLLKKDDLSMTLADAQGQEVEIALADVEEFVDRKVSIMPEMTETLSRRQIRDLLAFLLTLETEVRPTAR